MMQISRLEDGIGGPEEAEAVTESLEEVTGADEPLQSGIIIGIPRELWMAYGTNPE